MSSSAPTSQTEIINGALADLGSRSRINSISDPGNVAIQARTHWDAVVRETLPRHTWNHAITRDLLPLQEILAEGLGWKYAYLIPPDCARWLVPGREDGDLFFEGEEEGGRILTDREAPLPLRFVSFKLGADTSRWRPHFTAVIRTEMAARMADAITQSETVVQRTREMADAELKRGKRADGLATGRTQRGGVSVKSDWLIARGRPYQNNGYR